MADTLNKVEVSVMIKGTGILITAIGISEVFKTIWAIFMIDMARRSKTRMTEVTATILAREVGKGMIAGMKREALIAVSITSLMFWIWVVAKGEICQSGIRLE